MRKWTKGLLAVLLVVAVAVSACAFTGIFSSAQAIPENVSIAFSGTNDSKDDLITLDSSNTIQDKALTVTVYNYSESTIVLSAISNTGTSITYSGWTAGTELAPGGLLAVKLAGKTPNNAVFSVTVTYYVKGNPTTTKETCTAYIFASNAQNYTSETQSGKITGGWLAYMTLTTTTTLSPLSTATTTNRNVKRTLTIREYTSTEPETTASIYVDGSKYKTWKDLNMIFSLYNDGSDRDHSYYDQLVMTQTSNTGSLFFDAYGTDKDNKSITSTYSAGDDNTPASGFNLQAGKNATTSLELSGTIPTEASSKFDITLRMYGQTAGVFGYLSSATIPVYSDWHITVYNNDKTALRERLVEIANEGLNKSSYKEGWDNYESALKAAYTTLGTLNKTAAQVATALNNLNTAYNALVRYAVVYTNHYYYEGTNKENPVLKSSKIEMQVANGSNYTAQVLTSSDSMPFNRTDVTRTKIISVNASTNYSITLNQYYWYVDTSALDAAISEYSTTPYEDEEQNKLFTDDSWEAYASAVADGRTALTNLTLCQDEIDAATRAITDARGGLKRLDIDTEWLDEGITWASRIINNDYEGEDFGLDWDSEALFSSEYAGELYTALVTAYNNAVAVTEDPFFTKAQADSACAALWNAINNLRVVDESTAGVFLTGGVRHADVERYGYFKGLKDQNIDPNGLSVVFNNITSKTGSYSNLNEADFTAESWEALQNALYGDFAQGTYACAETDAYPSYDGESELTIPAYSMINNIWFLASQADYNACRDNLIDKVNNLEWIVDEAKIATLKELYQEALDLDLDLYITASKERLVGDIEYLEEKVEKLDDPQLYGDPDALKDEIIDEYILDLQEAIAALQLKPVLNPIAQNDVAFKGDEEVVIGETVGTTVAVALQDFDVENDSNLVETVIVDTEGNVIDDGAPIGTGYEIILRTVVPEGEESEVFERHVFVVKGDVLGDAQMTQADITKVVTFAFTEEGITVDSANYLAGDMNGDGVVDLTDAIMMDDLLNA